MAHLSGTFSHPFAGRLLMALSGTFYQGNYRDAGFPGTSGGVANFLVRAYIGPTGSLSYLEPIDRYAPVSVGEYDYPGGSVVWNIGTETITYVDPTSGLWSYGFDNLKISLVLRKR